jgi:hypothetical protein
MLSTTAFVTELESDEVCHMPIVKNTFITLLRPTDRAKRRKTVPADMHLLLGSCGASSGFNSEVSTDVSDDECPETDVSSSSHAPPPPSSVFTPLVMRSNGKSCWKHQYRKKYDAVMKRVGMALAESDLLAGVEISDDSQDCSITLRVRDDVDLVAEQVLAFAQKTLLELTTKSKCIYVMGYCTPQAFTRQTFGFEATLGAMENATKACWHVFKKGVCRHDVNCCKQHAIYKVPVRVFVEQV